MARRRKSYPDDDGRVIAPMNVEGMPWYRKPSDRPAGEKLTRGQTGHAILAALAAGMLIVAVFSVAAILFTLFCTHVWLK